MLLCRLLDDEATEIGNQQLKEFNIGEKFDLVSLQIRREKALQDKELTAETASVSAETSGFENLTAKTVLMEEEKKDKQIKKLKRLHKRTEVAKEAKVSIKLKKKKEEIDY